MKSYDDDDISHVRFVNVQEIKEEILRYKPGSFLEEAGGLQRSDYDIPKTTTLLLIGPRGSGKSSLVNKISRFLEHDEFASERAQVSYNLSGDGTHFLHEYMIPKGSTSFSVFDTRSLSEDSSENFKLLRNWMTKGVQHGRMVMRNSDSPTVKTIMKNKARHTLHSSSKKRMVNFVIFVVDGVSVLKAMTDEDSTQYTKTVSKAFNYPYLSFKDDKPVVVITHGDELAPADRVLVRIHLGELLGISPVTQIFDIPDNNDVPTDTAIVKMLRHSLEHADRNLPLKKDSPVTMIVTIALIVVIVVLLLLKLTNKGVAGRQSHIHRDWAKIRHIW
ncbi:uncharacterized protein LOC131234364 isoform X1 [Magnolia sinica]|uniref:uncharacterized protein LOC131234364 isoform X1 n=1 Tax=Magnolia sinica TaxID=86752 RepID=UPI00265A2560|nr:uncharacterized protein LOC131234364 isoform X1 [Magnolia sinica]